MALHDELTELRAQVGPQVFDDPVAFRAAFDDFIAEGSASTGEVSLLVGAIATGALRRLTEQLALGADPATSIAVQGDLMARDRGTSESDGCRWALSVLAHAAGAIPGDLVLTEPRIPDSLERPVADPPDRPAADATAPGVVDPGPTHRVTVAQGADPPPPTPLPGLSPATADTGRGGGRRTNPLLLGAVAVFALLAIVAIVLLFTRDGDSPDDDKAADESSSGGTETAGSEEVLAEVEMSEAGKTVRVQLVHDGTDTAVVLLSDADGDDTEVDREPVACPYLDISYDPVLQDEGNRQIFFGWQNTNTNGFGGYGEVQIDEDMLILFDLGDAPCPVAP